VDNAQNCVSYIKLLEDLETVYETALFPLLSPAGSLIRVPVILISHTIAARVVERWSRNLKFQLLL
jgi:hypothetical protein